MCEWHQTVGRQLANHWGVRQFIPLWMWQNPWCGPVMFLSSGLPEVRKIMCQKNNLTSPRTFREARRVGKVFATQRTQLPSISHHPRAPSHGDSFTIPCCATVPRACKVGFCFAAHVCSEWLVHPNSAAEPGLVGHISALTACSFHRIRP